MEDGKEPGPGPAGVQPTNAEVARLIEQILVRFKNWRLEAELNPNPRMVHSLANILALVDALTEETGKKMQYSYKELLGGMARLVDDTARLNNTVVEALEDDSISRDELQGVSERLVALVNSAMRLVRLLQSSFADGDASAAFRLIEPPMLDEGRSAPAARNPDGFRVQPEHPDAPVNPQ